MTDQLDAERENFQASVQTGDFQQGLEAFFAKRPAISKGLETRYRRQAANLHFPTVEGKLMKTRITELLPGNCKEK